MSMTRLEITRREDPLRIHQRARFESRDTLLSVERWERKKKRKKKKKKKKKKKREKEKQEEKKKRKEKKRKKKKKERDTSGSALRGRDKVIRRPNTMQCNATRRDPYLAAAMNHSDERQWGMRREERRGEPSRIGQTRLLPRYPRPTCAPTRRFPTRPRSRAAEERARGKSRSRRRRGGGGNGTGGFPPSALRIVYSRRINVYNVAADPKSSGGSHDLVPDRIVFDEERTDNQLVGQATTTMIMTIMIMTKTMTMTRKCSRTSYRSRSHFRVHF